MKLRATRRRLIGGAIACLLLAAVGVSLLRLRLPASVDSQLKLDISQAYQGNAAAISRVRSYNTNVIPALTLLLRTKDSAFRKIAWSLLRKQSAAPRQAVASHFPPPSAEHLREAACRALGLLGTNAVAAVPALGRALRDNEGRVRMEAAAALVAIGTNSIPVLLASLDDSDARVRQFAAGALGELPATHDDTLVALKRLLSDPDDRVRYAAAYALARKGTAGVLALVSVAKSGDPGLAQASAKGMLTNAFIPLRTAGSRFFVMAQSTNATERVAAVEALGFLTANRDLAMMVSLEALRDPSPEVRLAGIATLDRLSNFPSEVVLAVRTCLKDEAESVRSAAAALLDKLSK